ncbi:MAG: ABC transporter ATP-binding protein [Saprospiraceae bacterium]|jgi:putative ABC transport system ATP-binding protein|nr:ABC transporter ATP-binding protein [Saprospiraceae bacterium]MBP6236722.1 ABC transporter ATP-binding protein [Saprospiraceae bacterium]
MSVILKVDNLDMQYSSGNRSLSVLQSINMSIEEGETVAITGPSGSGKTTLMGLCAALDNPTSGAITLLGTLINPLSEDERARLRNRFVGFIFQNFQLLPSLTALENVMLPLELQGIKGADQEAVQLLTRVGLKDRMTHYPSQLSGGEQQRVALARAFINKPKILFADEPTGNLDGDTGSTVESLMFDLNKDFGTTLIIVTHNQELASRTGRIIKLRSGHIISDEKNIPSMTTI